MSNDQEKLVISRRTEILGAWAAELLGKRDEIAGQFVRHVKAIYGLRNRDADMINMLVKELTGLASIREIKAMLEAARMQALIEL
jgi:hypothetical protein